MHTLLKLPVLARQRQETLGSGVLPIQRRKQIVQCRTAGRGNRGKARYPSELLAPIAAELGDGI